MSASPWWIDVVTKGSVTLPEGVYTHTFTPREHRLRFEKPRPVRFVARRRDRSRSCRRARAQADATYRTIVRWLREGK